MTGGKHKLAQLFTSEMKVDEDGTTVRRILSGSAVVTIPASAMEGAGVSVGLCAVTEVTIADLSACDIIIGNVEGLSACITYGHTIAGAGTASVVTHVAPSIVAALMDAGTATLRYIAFKL